MGGVDARERGVFTGFGAIRVSHVVSSGLKCKGIRTCIHTYIHTYVHTYVHAYMQAYIPTYRPTYMYAYMLH